MNRISKYKLWIGGAICLAVIGLIIATVRPKHVSGAQPSASPDVEVVQVEQKDVPIYGEWIGTLDGLTNADVRAQVTGYIMRQGYQEGAFVKKGQLLFEIDPRPFQAALDQAEGQLAQAKAALANAQAVQGRTELDVNRYTPLAKEQAASQQDLDNAVQNNMAAKATVATAQAQIKSAEAAVETARINLDFTRLIAPIDGIAGQAQSHQGLFHRGRASVSRMAKALPDRVQPSGGRQESAPPTDPGRRLNVSLRGLLLLRRPPSQRGHGRHSDRRFVFESIQYSAARRLRQSSCGHPAPTRCAACSSAGGVGAPRRLSGCGCRQRRQSEHTNGHGRRSCWFPMDYCGRAEPRRKSCRRGCSEGAPRRAREPQAVRGS